MDTILESVIPLAGGSDNISFQRIKGGQIFLRLKNQSLLDTSALQGLEGIKGWSLKNGQLKITLPDEQKEVDPMANNKKIAQEVLKAIGGLQNRPDVQTHLVLTRGGELTLRQECGTTAADLSALADVTHQNENLGAAIASGSFKTLGMVVVPCSMKTAAGIATGYSDNLLLRAADVTLKERRKLVLVARESPLSTLHLRNLCTGSELGAELTARAVVLLHGVQVSLIGGTLPHTGAVSVAGPTGEVQTTEFPGHRDGVLSGRWAAGLAAAGLLPAVVAAGVHYDSITKEGIAAVCAASDTLLRQCIKACQEIAGENP